MFLFIFVNGKYTSIRNKYFKEEVDEKKQLIWSA